jgi:hypothetical protein
MHSLTARWSVQADRGLVARIWACAAAFDKYAPGKPGRFFLTGQKGGLSNTVYEQLANTLPHIAILDCVYWMIKLAECFQAISSAVIDTSERHANSKARKPDGAAGGAAGARLETFTKQLIFWLGRLSGASVADSLTGSTLAVVGVQQGTTTHTLVVGAIQEGLLPVMSIDARDRWPRPEARRGCAQPTAALRSRRSCSTPPQAASATQRTHCLGRSRACGPTTRTC